MHKPLVSVIVPVYNKEKHLRKTIESVLDQEFKDFEIILIDDGSVDGSRKIIEEFARIDPRCKYFYQKNSGVSSARNHGIRVSYGDYICFLDADDAYEKEFLKEMVALSEGVDFVYCGHAVLHERLKKATKSKIKFVKHDFFLSYIKNITTPNTNSWLIRKEFIMSYSIWFDETISWGEDMLFFSTVGLLAGSYMPCKGFYTRYNMYNEDSLTSSYSFEKKIKIDMVWLDKLECLINSYKIKEAKLYISVLTGYRRPASVIYSVMSLFNNSGQASAKKVFDKYRQYLLGISFCNGLRSVKLHIFYVYIKLRFIIEK